MAAHTRRRLGRGAGAFGRAAAIYWLEVHPRVHRELCGWQAIASAIPDTALRRAALATLEGERSNLEGAAAFAVLAPHALQAQIVRATVAFQVAYDYVDTLAEQPCAEPLANGRQLHLALGAAVRPGTRHADYYAHHHASDDGGYLARLTDTAGSAVAKLPSWRSVAAPARRAVARMAAYQDFNHAAAREGPGALASWATRLTPAGSGLLWWETAAGAASSLLVFALLAAAAQPALRAAELGALERAYFPWIGALHVLLDSLVDRSGDIARSEHSLLGHYRSSNLEAERMGADRDTRPGGHRDAPIQRTPRPDPRGDEQLLPLRAGREQPRRRPHERERA